MKLQSCKVTTSIVASQTNAKDLSTPQADVVKKYEQSYDDGTLINQAQVVFADTRPVASSATDNLDLAGALAHELGGTITFTAIKEIIFRAAAANTGDIRIGKGVTNAFQGPFGATAVGILLPPGGIIHLRNPSAAGWAVTGGTADVLSVENLVAAAGSYDVIIIGEGTVA